MWEVCSMNDYRNVRKYYLEKFDYKGTGRVYGKNKVISFDRGENVMLISSGRVKISTVSESGNEKILYILSEGDLIGEIDFFNKFNHDYEVTSLTKCTVKILETKDIQMAMLEDVGLYDCIIKSIIRKYQIVTSQLTDTVFKDSEGKIASALIRIASQEGKIVDGHIEYFYLKHQDIADLLGCSRVTITKVLKKFRDENIIDISDNKIKILQRDKLLTYI